MPILLPGVGTQGGSLEDVVRIFLDKNKPNYLVNISRALIYADDSMNFESVIREKIRGYNQSVRKILDS
jgi:orotidine-5'-phosphate decarboxylase